MKFRTQSIVTLSIIVFCSLFSLAAFASSDDEVPFENVRIAIPSENSVRSFVKDNSLDFSPSKQEGFQDTKIRLGLSIDGGGIRGLMPAIWLKELDNCVRDEIDEKISLSRVFDYVGGTSIGGILSLGIAIDLSTDKLISLFYDEDKRSKVFSVDLKRKLIRLVDFFGLFSHRYDAAPFEGLLKEEFKNITLRQVRTNVLVTACTDNGYPCIFSSENSKRNIQEDYEIWQVARSTSAAPTYFSQYRLQNQFQTTPYLVDGGLWINNPSTLVASSIIKRYQNGYFNPDNLYMLSLGTGEMPNEELSVDFTGKASAGKIISSLMTSNSRGNHVMMSQLLESNYYRVNPSIDFIELDDIRKASIDKLKKCAEDSENIGIVKSFFKKTEDIIRKNLDK